MAKIDTIEKGSCEAEWAGFNSCLKKSVSVQHWIIIN
jgi:hypothetical protein